MYLSLALYANACAFELGEPLSLLSSGYRASIFQWWYLHENDKEIHCLQLLSLHHAPSGSSPVNARRGPGYWAPLALCQEPWEEGPCRTSRQRKSSLLPCVHHLWVTIHPSLLVNCLLLHPLPVISLTSVTIHPSLLVNCLLLHPLPVISLTSVTIHPSLLVNCLLLHPLPVISLTSVTIHPSLLVNCLPLHPLPVISLTSVTNHPSLASTYVRWTNLVNW